MTSNNYQLSGYPIHELTQTEYPALFEVSRPPKQLLAQGQPQALELLRHLPERGLGVVGTRQPLPRSVSHVRSLISELSTSGLIIVSGFARGIDACAHQSAIDAGLPTIAILGAGLDIPYPYEHTYLRQRLLASGGLMISEFAMGTNPLGGQFIQRNRLIAEWSKAVWIAEAPHRSGALNTASWAMRQHRNCYATPCFPGDPSMAGNQRLLDLDTVTAMWGPHSLGSTWIELAAQNKRQLTLVSDNCPDRRPSDELSLASQAKIMTLQQGGAEVSELLNWAISMGWSAQRFYLALKNAIQSCVLLDNNGLVLKNDRTSD